MAVLPCKWLKCYSSTITGAASLNLVLEVEFQHGDSLVQVAFAIWQDNAETQFETWFSREADFEYFHETLVPDGLTVTEGTLGLYSDGLHVLPYFKDAAGVSVYPFDAWDISVGEGIHAFNVDNDFEAYTDEGGTIVASVNLKHVVYGVPEPASLCLLALGGLALLRRRRN